LRIVPGLIHDLDLTRLDDKEVQVAVAGLEELLAVLELMERRQRAFRERRHLSLVKRREKIDVSVMLGHVSFSAG
jgi:hypothetical protein